MPRVVRSGRNGTWGAYLLAVASSLGYATLGIFALFGYRHHLSTVTMLTWRFAGAALVLFLWAAMTRQRWPNWTDLLVLSCMGAVGYTVMSWLFVEGNRLAPVGLVSAALYTYPALVTIVLAALGWEPLTRRKLTALVGTGAGAALVVLFGRGDLAGGGVHLLLGITAGFATAVVYVAYIVVGTPVLRRVSAPAASAIVTGTAAVALLLTGLGTGGLQPLAYADSWIILGLVGPATVLAVVGFFVAMQGIGSGQAAIVSNVEPVGAVILGWLIFGQALSPGQILGVGLVISSAVLLRWETPAASQRRASRSQAL